MKKKIILITGGARSGKSQFAVNLAKKTGNKIIYLATMHPEDEEMQKRVDLHKKQRPSHWKTIEKQRDIALVLKEIEGLCEVLIIDCLTLFISNLIFAGKDDEEIRREVEITAECAISTGYNVIIVTNEVGGGLVPENALGRRFRDISGLANQIMASFSHEVYFLISGIPLKIKGEN